VAGDDSECGILLKAWLCVLADINGGGKGVCKEWPFKQGEEYFGWKGAKGGDSGERGCDRMVDDGSRRDMDCMSLKTTNGDLRQQNDVLCDGPRGERWVTDTLEGRSRRYVGIEMIRPSVGRSIAHRSGCLRSPSCSETHPRGRKAWVGWLK
jgi:hypothetical protein